VTLRERINSDPKLQIGIGAVLLLLVAFVFLGKGGGSEEAATEEPTAAVSESGVSIEPGVVEAAGVGSEPSLTALSASVPAPPMPVKVTRAYNKGKVVTVLFVHDGGIDDRLVQKYATLLRNSVSAKYRHELAFFVVPAKKIANWGAITLGLGIQRVPAFVVLRPKKLSGATPQGTVLYGYQTPPTIAQEIADSIYRGPEAAYHPG
jgi:hypothetical protein